MSAKDAKVLNITILNGDGSEAGPFLEALNKAGVTKEYFVYVSVKPFKFATRQEFAQLMEYAMKGLKGEPIPPNVGQPQHEHPTGNPLFEPSEE